MLYYICYSAIILCLCGYGAHRFLMLYLYFKHKNHIPQPQSNFDELPKVTIQLPIFNEQYVTERLLQKVSEMDYPKDKLHIQILDDSTDETQEIAQNKALELKSLGYNVDYHHRTNRTGFKAGALENGLKHTDAEYLLILDADFSPQASLLQNTIHYFTNPNLAVVQTRWGHINRNYNLLTRIQAILLDGHLQIEQTARCRSGRFFTFNGTAGIWRKQAIEDAGGWEHDTLTEDMDLSYRAQLKGWKFLFLNHIETPAELPPDVNSFKSQQHRWAKGAIQCCLKILPTIWKSKAPLFIKLEATSHLTSNFAYLLLLMLAVLLNPQFNSPELPVWLDILMQAVIYTLGSISLISFYLISQLQLNKGSIFSFLIKLPLLMGVGVGMSINNAKAVLEAIFHQHSSFVRTPKYCISKEGKVPIKKILYRPIKSFTVLFEVLFGCYFTFLVSYFLVNHNYLGAILLAIFPIGFFYIAFNSLFPNLFTAHHCSKNT